MEKTVLITGASRGIGAAAARAFAAEGARVLLNYRQNAAAAEALAKELGGMALPADVSDAAAVDKLFSEAERLCGPVDILVNNAGMALPPDVFQNCTEEDWDRLFAVNVKGVFLCCRRAVGPMLRRGGGVILNVSSIWGVMGGSCEACYSAAKAAVIGFTRALAQELGPSGIRVNCVAPGAVPTDMNAHLSPEDWEALRGETPLGRFPTAGDIAESLVFLASEKAASITGQVLGVNGGFCL